jgi:hypothetical protein
MSSRSDPVSSAPHQGRAWSETGRLESLTDLPADPGVDAEATVDDADTPKRPERWLWIPGG